MKTVEYIIYVNEPGGEFQWINIALGYSCKTETHARHIIDANKKLYPKREYKLEKKVTEIKITKTEVEI